MQPYTVKTKHHLRLNGFLQILEQEYAIAVQGALMHLWNDTMAASSRGTEKEILVTGPECMICYQGLCVVDKALWKTSDS